MISGDAERKRWSYLAHSGSQLQCMFGCLNPLPKAVILFHRYCHLRTEITVNKTAIRYSLLLLFKFYYLSCILFYFLVNWHRFCLLPNAVDQEGIRSDVTLVIQPINTRYAEHKFVVEYSFPPTVLNMNYVVINCSCIFNCGCSLSVNFSGYFSLRVLETF